MLRCEACGRKALGKARDWIAVLVDDPEGKGSPRVLTYCPACATQFAAEDREDREKRPL
jgi:hypothetical protein